MLRAAATCEGISPYLMNPATDELLDQLRGRVRPTKNKDRPVEEEAAEKLCTDDDGNPGVPSLNLFASMIIAGRKVKNGKTQVSTATTTTLPGLLAIEELFLPFTNQPQWAVDKRRGVNGKGEALCLIRPRFDKWGFSLHLNIDETEISPDTVREILRISGSFVGLGDFRPAKRGPFGRFRIAKWEDLGVVED